MAEKAREFVELAAVRFIGDATRHCYRWRRLAWPAVWHGAPQRLVRVSPSTIRPAAREKTQPHGWQQG